MFDWLDKLVRLLVENVFSLSMETGIGSSVHFFIYDTIKIIILLAVMNICNIIHPQLFPAGEKTKKVLSKFSGLGGNFTASLLGHCNALLLVLVRAAFYRVRGGGSAAGADVFVSYNIAHSKRGGVLPYCWARSAGR